MKNAHRTNSDNFLKGIFDSNRWESYIRRENILLSSNFSEWNLIDFPIEISLELTNYCNLKCIICPVPNLKRNRGFMEDVIYNKVIEEISKELGFLFLPQGFGESLLHEKYSQFMVTAKNAGVRPIVVLTNGMLLVPKNILMLLTTADVVIVTIDGITSKTYESIRVNSNFEMVIRNIEQFLKARHDKQIPRLILRIIRMKETEAEVEAFQTYWSKKLHKSDLIQVAAFNDWTGKVVHRGAEGSRSTKNRQPCRTLWKNLTVYYNGYVSPCCYDAEGELEIGSIVDKSLRELWHGAPLNALRKKHLAYEFERIPLCSRCRNWL